MAALRWLIAAVSLTGLLLILGGGPAVAQDDENIRESDGYVEILDVTYEVLPDEDRVAATRLYTIRNLRPNQYQADGSYTYWIIRAYPIVIERDVTDLVITSNGGPLTFVENEESEENGDDAYAVYDVTLPYDLVYPNSQTLRVEYSLPSYGTAGSEDSRRINTAFFQVDLVTCCNFEEITSRVVMPQEFKTAGPQDPNERPGTAGPNEYTEELVDGQRIFTFTDSETTGDYTDLLVESWTGENNDGYARTEIDLGDAAITVVSAPDDQVWNDRVSDAVREISAELEALTGAPWPVDRNVFFRQAQTLLYDERMDAIGWHGPLNGRVDVPDNFTDKHIAYTLARGWFGDVPFTDRWIKEGYTLEFASQAYENSGRGSWDAREPQGSQSLTAWVPIIQSYTRAHYVIGELADEIGTEGLLELFTLAETDETAFVGGDAPESTDAPEDWRRFLDLAEQRLGAASFEPVMSEYVVASVQEDMIADRNGAIAAVTDLFGPDWTGADGAVAVPVGIRTALSEWDITTVGELTDSSTDLLDHQAALMDRATDMQLAPDLSFVQSGISDVGDAGDIEAIDGQLAAYDVALDQIETAEARNSQSLGFVPELGLRGTDLDKTITQARAAFDAGDLGAVEAQTNELASELDGADSAGQRRLLLWIVLPMVVAVVAFVLLALWWRSRRKAKQARSDVADAEAQVRTEMAAMIDMTGAADGTIDVRDSVTKP